VQFALVVVFPFLFTCLAIYRCVQGDWPAGWALASFFVMWLISLVGITVGFHRMLAHHSFEGKGWVKSLLLALGSMAGQGPPLYWASLHRQHHHLSDQEGGSAFPARAHGRVERVLACAYRLGTLPPAS